MKAASMVDMLDTQWAEMLVEPRADCVEQELDVMKVECLVPQMVHSQVANLVLKTGNLQAGKTVEHWVACSELSTVAELAEKKAA